MKDCPGHPMVKVAGAFAGDLAIQGGELSLKEWEAAIGLEPRPLLQVCVCLEGSGPGLALFKPKHVILNFQHVETQTSYSLNSLKEVIEGMK